MVHRSPGRVPRGDQESEGEEILVYRMGYAKRCGYDAVGVLESTKTTKGTRDSIFVPPPSGHYPSPLPTVGTSLGSRDTFEGRPNTETRRGAAAEEKAGTVTADEAPNIIRV